VERRKPVRKQVVIVDPNKAEQAIYKGVDSIERGHLIELKGHQEYQAFFADIVERGKKRFAAKKAAPEVKRYVVSAGLAPIWTASATSRNAQAFNS
jgi:hypothetical protein